MKNVTLLGMLLVFVACSNTQLSHTDTTKIVVESFYNKDNTKLKKHTTADSYASFMAVQNIVTAGDSDNQESNFKLLQESIDGNIAWVKFTTSFEKKPETFKLTNADGQWKVMRKEVREKSPF